MRGRVIDHHGHKVEGTICFFLEQKKRAYTYQYHPRFQQRVENSDFDLKMGQVINGLENSTNAETIGQGTKNDYESNEIVITNNSKKSLKQPLLLFTDNEENIIDKMPRSICNGCHARLYLSNKPTNICEEVISIRRGDSKPFILSVHK